MSQQGTSMSQRRSQLQGSPSPPVDSFVFLDEEDVQEQLKIQKQLASTLESTFEAAVQEALRRSLLSCPENQTVQTEGAVGDAVPEQPSLGAADRDTDMSRAPSGAFNNMDDTAVASRAAASPQPAVRTQLQNVGSSYSPRSHVVDTHFNGLPKTGDVDSSDADDETESDEMPRSRRGRYQRQQQMQSERRPSLDRMNGRMSERRPSVEGMSNHMSERRPSLDRMNQYHSERRPSLERQDCYVSERRPSLEHLGYHRSERRPSLERQKDYRSERRPSLDRMLGQQVAGGDARGSERRPSLERVGQQERRASLDRIQSAAECLQSINRTDASSGPTQGINTLRPWPLNEHGIPTNWDVTQMPGSGMYQLVPLSPVDQEYSAITVDFEEAGMKVLGVERLQSLAKLKEFNHEKESLLENRPQDFELNERYLYHGTQANKFDLCEEGLDQRLSFQGCFGRGVYFSDNPRKCMQYAMTTNSSPGQYPMVLVCRVLLGESKVYSQGIKESTLKREPEKLNAKGGRRFYDSVQGVPVDYPEFVVYRNTRSMIEYIVTFEEVAYRAPPAPSNFYQTPVPSLYKVEPVVLPIPEDELDRMYMLCPDTDSDGSCDEHTREVERLRDNVKRAKAQRLGIPYRPPTKEEKRYERLHWKRVCYYSCPPGSPLFEMMIIKKKQEKADRKKRKAEERAKKAAQEGKETGAAEEEEALGAVGGSKDTTRTSAKSSEQKQQDSEDRDIFTDQILSNLIAEFMNLTSTDDVETARRYILDNSWDPNKAVNQFFNDLE